MKRSEYMSGADQTAMGKLARTHENCLEKTGVRRPGKTKQDNSRRGRK